MMEDLKLASDLKTTNHRIASIGFTQNRVKKKVFALLFELSASFHDRFIDISQDEGASRKLETPESCEFSL